MGISSKITVDVQTEHISLVSTLLQRSNISYPKSCSSTFCELVQLYEQYGLGTTCSGNNLRRRRPSSHNSSIRLNHSSEPPWTPIVCAQRYYSYLCHKDSKTQFPYPAQSLTQLLKSKIIEHGSFVAYTYLSDALIKITNKKKVYLKLDVTYRIISHWV